MLFCNSKFRSYDTSTKQEISENASLFHPYHIHEAIKRYRNLGDLRWEDRLSEIDIYYPILPSIG